jgi:hypothetical protein
MGGLGRRGIINGQARPKAKCAWTIDIVSYIDKKKKESYSETRAR